MLQKKPSKEYIKNINYYKKMHLEGYSLIDGRKRKPAEAYNGKSTLIYAKLIKEIIEKNDIKTMLDYGCGKGFYYDNPFNSNGLNIKSLRSYWKIDIDLYDPCFDKYSILDDNKKFDLTICIDVLEHIPTSDINWVLEKIIGKANKYVFMNIACHPAIALLPNKKNAHISIKPPQWWHQKILNFKKNLNEIKIICVCSIKENDMIKYYPLQYDDKLSNYETK